MLEEVGIIDSIPDGEEAFHSLLGLLDPSFLSLTGDLADEERQTERRRFLDGARFELPVERGVRAS